MHSVQYTQPDTNGEINFTIRTDGVSEQALYLISSNGISVGYASFWWPMFFEWEPCVIFSSPLRKMARIVRIVPMVNANVWWWMVISNGSNGENSGLYWSTDMFLCTKAVCIEYLHYVAPKLYVSSICIMFDSWWLIYHAPFSNISTTLCKGLSICIMFDSWWLIYNAPFSNISTTLCKVWVSALCSIHGD